MKRIFLLIAVLLINGVAAIAQNKWKVDKTHAKISFSIRHMMLSSVEGNFRKFEATIVSSKPDFSDAVFEVIVDVASINTDNEKRDNDLKSDKYFNAAKYPEITFKSTSLTKTGENAYKVSGKLTMHGVTRPVTLELTLDGTRKSTAGFKVTGVVTRTEFGIGNVPKAMMGDDVTIHANGEFSRE